ncbi:MAG TPA: cytochrome c [Longimicrobiales bacterium]
MTVIRALLDLFIVLLMLAPLAGCGPAGESAEPAAAGNAATAAAAPGLDITEDELKYGIGPIRRVELGPLDDELAEQGERLFEMKCMACHRLDERYVGPALRGVTERRTPEYVMNMMLNPGEMVRRHPAARALLLAHYTEMPAQNLTEAEARALLEYLREQTAEGREEREHDRGHDREHDRRREGGASTNP